VKGTLAAFLSLLLAGCMTAYQPRGMTGGYEEQKLDEHMYRVSFYGNGNTPRAAVLKYFLYRCAELTLERGFAYFELYSPGRAELPGEGRFVRAGAGAPAAPPVQMAQYTTYTITTWSASAIVRMYPGDVMAGAPTLFSAREVTSLLAADVRSGAPSGEIPAKFRAVEGKFPVLPEDRVRQRAAKPSAPPAGAVQLDDLKDLLPK
jgi:hypothetical protein